jgi:hypothetical protein
VLLKTGTDSSIPQQVLSMASVLAGAKLFIIPFFQLLKKDIKTKLPENVIWATMFIADLMCFAMLFFLLGRLFIR